MIVWTKMINQVIYGKYISINFQVIVCALILDENDYPLSNWF